MNKYENIDYVWEQHRLNNKFVLFSCLYSFGIKTPQEICKLILSLNKKEGNINLNGVEIKYCVIFNSRKNEIITLFYDDKMMLFDVEKGTIEIYTFIQEKKNYVKLIFKKNCCVLKGTEDNKEIERQFTTFIGLKL